MRLAAGLIVLIPRARFGVVVIVIQFMSDSATTALFARQRAGAGPGFGQACGAFCRHHGHGFGGRPPDARRPAGQSLDLWAGALTDSAIL